MLIKNGRIHVGNGQVLENTDILIDKGIIVKIAENLRSDNREVIDAKDNEVFPGFIDPVSSVGSMDITFRVHDQDETSNPIKPDVKIKYSFNPGEVMMEELYKVGITTLGASPGNSNIIGGQMAVYKTWGNNTNKMLVREPAGLKGSVTSRVKEAYGKREVFPKTKMGIFEGLEEMLRKADNDIIKKVLDKELPLFINANKASEIQALINVVKPYDIKLVICGAYQADRCMEAIREIGASVVIGEQIYLTAKEYNATDLYRIAGLVKDGGLVSITLTADDGPVGRVKYLWNAIEMYKAGVDSEDVVSMMTRNPAKMLGVEDRLGTLEEGKDGDVVIYTGNPIECYDARVSHTIMEGKLIYRGGGEKECC